MALGALLDLCRQQAGMSLEKPSRKSQTVHGHQAELTAMSGRVTQRNQGTDAERAKFSSYSWQRITTEIFCVGFVVGFFKSIYIHLPVNTLTMKSEHVP